MANLIDITASTLSQNTFCFESSNVDIEKIPAPFENAKFVYLILQQLHQQKLIKNSTSYLSSIARVLCPIDVLTIEARCNILFIH